MKRIIHFLLFLIILVPFSCSKSNDAAPSGGTGTNSGNAATIDGQTFSPTDTKATSTGTGLSISLKDASKEISLSTSDKIAGTYTIANSVPGGRSLATLTANVSYYDGADLYFGSAGTIIITLDASGNASGTFSITFKTPSGKTIELKDGKFTTLTVGTTPAGKCLISKIKASSSTLIFDYDGDGKLVQYLIVDGTYSAQVNFYFTAGVMTYLMRTEISNGKTNVEYEYWTYTSGRVALITLAGASGGTTDTYNLDYNSAGQVSKVTWSRGSVGSTSVLEYDASGNVTKSTSNYTGSSGGSTSSSVYSNYDSKPNYALILAQTLGTNNQAFFISGQEQFGAEFSKNNLGTDAHTSAGTTDTDTYTYEYNAKGYVTNYKYTSSCSTCDTDNATFEYVGCN